MVDLAPVCADLPTAQSYLRDLTIGNLSATHIRDSSVSGAGNLGVGCSGAAEWNWHLVHPAGMVPRSNDGIAQCPLPKVLIMRKVAVVLASVVCLILSGCARKKSGDSYGFVTNGIAAFWTIGIAGVRAAEADLGVTVKVSQPTSKGGAGDQKSALEDMLSMGVKGIAISPIDPANQTGLLNSVAAKTILLTHDSDAPDSDRICYIGVDNYAAGRLCGEMIKAAIPGGGKVMLFIGNLGQANSQGRRQGVIDVLMGHSADPKRRTPNTYPIKSSDGKYSILGCLTDNFDFGVAKENAEDTLTDNPDLACMVGLFEYNPPLILEALEAADRLGKVKVIGFDENDATLEGIRRGTVAGTIVQNPYMYGYKSVELMVAIAKGDTSAVPAGGFLDIPARKIDTSNVDAFQAELKKRLGK
jgi:ribose transport system substrate-binding protein